MSIKLIVGLGNPGSRYEDTRHNAGFWLADEIVRQFGDGFRSNAKLAGDIAEASVANRRVRLLKPETFVNASGQSVGQAARYFGIEAQEILVAHDELDLAPGSARLKCGGGHGGHNGLRDIIPHLGSPDFYRLRIGVGHPGSRNAVTGWVLSRPGREEAMAINEAIERIVGILPDLAGGEIERATKALHSADPAKQKPEKKPMDDHDQLQGDQPQDGPEEDQNDGV